MLPKYLTERVQYMVEQAVQFGTDKTYNSAYNQYKKFVHEYGLPLWPSDPKQLELQLMYWHAKRLEQVKGKTIRSQYYGVKRAAALQGAPIDDSKMYLLKQQRK